MPRTTKSSTTIKPEAPSVADTIRQRAYQLWEQDRHTHGKDMDHWLKAETEVKKKTPASAPKKRPPRAKK